MIIKKILLYYTIFLIISISIRIMIRDNLRKLFIQVISFLTNKIEYWVDYGTLLGLHREKDIIIGDTDCDICIWKKDEDIIRSILQTFVDSTSNLSLKEYGESMFRIVDKTKYHCYIDIYKATINETTNKIIIPDSKDTPTELLSSFEIVNLPFYNQTIEVRQPVKWRELLEFRYTKNWIKPINKWWTGYFPISSSKEIF